MNLNSSSRNVGSIFRNYVKYEHGFEAKLQWAKKGFRACDNFYSCPKLLIFEM